MHNKRVSRWQIRVLGSFERKQMSCFVWEFVTGMQCSWLRLLGKRIFQLSRKDLLESLRKFGEKRDALCDWERATLEFWESNQNSTMK